MTTPQALALARKQHHAARFAEAEAAYREIVVAEPQNAEAWHLLGVLTGQRGCHAEAAALIGQSVALRPDHPEAHKNLGVALKAAGRDDEAIAAYRQAIAIQPDYVEAHKNLGNLLLDKGEIDPAIAAYREAIARSRPAAQNTPILAAIWNRLGIALILQHQTDEAIAACQNAIALRPDYAEAFANLGHALKEQGRMPEAIAAYRQAIELKPASPDWQHVLAALSGDTAPTTTPASYVRNLFDPYAAEFDAHLTGALDYRVPEMLLEAVLATAPGRTFATLDLGCGTGLCGAQFRRIATRLIGVDLSPAMIEKAAARKIYDELITAEVSDAMRDWPDHFDLILAGDLFIYVGDLSATFRCAAHLLQEDGLFAFSLERHDGEGFTLTSKIRFAHSLDYIRRLSSDHNFAELHLREIVVRKSGAGEIPGWIVLLQKSSGQSHTH